MLYGRRRVGKTVLLRHWAEASDLSHTYWAAEKEPAPLQRRKLFARVLGVEPARTAAFETWTDCAGPIFLLYDEVREPRTYLAILKAIGTDHHTLAEIANASLVGRTHLSSYLARLQELRLVERRLPVTVPPAQRRRARQGRYHLSNPYFRFYFRLIVPSRMNCLN